MCLRLAGAFAKFQTSGKEMMLPSPPPLRTRRASFPAARSSLSNAFHRTRFCHDQTRAMNLPMADWMQKHQVTDAVAAAARSPNDVMGIPSRRFRDLLDADRALTILFIPKIEEFPVSLQLLRHLYFETMLSRVGAVTPPRCMRTPPSEPCGRC